MKIILAIDRNAQGTLFITPRGLIDTAGDLEIKPASLTILIASSKSYYR